MTKAQKVVSLHSKSPEDSFYELLFQEANDAILIVDLHNKCISRANKKLQELTGFLNEELESNEISLLIPKNDDSQTIVPYRSQSLNFQMLSQSGLYEDISIAKKDGYLAFINLSVRTLTAKDTGGHEVSFCILRDIGEKKIMERDLIAKHSELKNAYMQLESAHMELKSAQEALVQAGKLAALGELAAGVAHELNQPLTAIMGFSQEMHRILEKENKDPILKDYTDEVVKNSVRLKKIIQQLREFTRKSTEDLQNTDVESVIEESLKLLETQFKSRGIEVEINSDKSLPKVYCNPFQLEQVFINLATNARDAIEEKEEANGRIKIEIHKSKKDKRFIEIKFQDNGMGMQIESTNRAFEPFFTTKEVGKGTGLGLSVSFGIIEKINGTMMIESSPGVGTSFLLKLPIDFRKLNKQQKGTE